MCVCACLPAVSLTQLDADLKCSNFSHKPNCLCGFCVIVSHPQDTDHEPHQALRHPDWGQNEVVTLASTAKEGRCRVQHPFKSITHCTDLSQSSSEILDSSWTLSCAITLPISPSPTRIPLSRVHMLADTSKHTEWCNFSSWPATPDVHVIFLMQVGPWINLHNLTLSPTLAQNSHIAKAHYRLK